VAISDGKSLDDTMYLAFKGVTRSAGPVGTFMFTHSVIGDATGGSVAIGMQMKRQHFGFYALLVPTNISIQDDLATAEVVLLGYSLTNARTRGIGVGSALQDVILPTAAVGGQNIGRFIGSKAIMEGLTDDAQDVLVASWSTNTNLKVYRMVVYGVVYDAEAISSYFGDLQISGPLAGPL